MALVLTPRQYALLWQVIDKYIETGEPVSSKALATSGAFEVGSATIRNELAEMEEGGYLEQLHTSGGRVPTARAYRAYVNGLIASEGVAIGVATRRRIDEALNDINLRDAELVNRTLAKIVGQISQNLVLANMESRPQPYTVGLSGMMLFPEFQNANRLAGLAQFIDEFEDVFQRLHQQLWSRDDGEVKICIGAENPTQYIQDETMIVARYRLPGGHEGTLTLIGPMRMDYRKNLGLVTYAAQTANRIAHHYRK
jgi:heat-inducible transcriptional repressor